jgi:ferredoxin
MISQIVLNNLLANDEIVKINTSKCLRLRLADSDCNECAKVCMQNSIEFISGISINYKTCSECLLCTAACPNDALITTFPLLDVIKKSKRLDSIVLSCNSSKISKANFRTPCLGWISEEILIYLFQKSNCIIQLDLSSCKNCKNFTVQDELELKYKNVELKLAINLSEKITLNYSEESLIFSFENYNRRNFFKVLKAGAINNTVMFSDNKNKLPEYNDYKSKAVPLKKSLLNEVSGENISLGKQINTAYSYQVKFSNECTNCNDCEVICPTGAISESEEQNSPDFDSTKCIGCDLCRIFCEEDAIKVLLKNNEETLLKVV